MKRIGVGIAAVAVVIAAALAVLILRPSEEVNACAGVTIASVGPVYNDQPGYNIPLQEDSGTYIYHDERNGVWNEFSFRGEFYDSTAENYAYYCSEIDKADHIECRFHRGEGGRYGFMMFEGQPPNEVHGSRMSAVAMIRQPDQSEVWIYAKSSDDLEGAECALGRAMHLLEQDMRPKAPETDPETE